MIDIGLDLRKNGCFTCNIIYPIQFPIDAVFIVSHTAQFLTRGIKQKNS